MTVGRIAVVGASAAGLAAVEALRRGGWSGELTLVGDEPHLPYDRPPLSKQLLSGDWETDKLGLRTAEQLDALNMDVRLGTKATALDAGTRTLTLDDGDRLATDGVIVATGVRARTLPGLARLDGVHTLRTLDDALGLRTWLSGAPRRLVVAGNGVLGCEAAAVARELGHEVTLVGRDPLPMGRLVGDGVGALLAAEHERHGVRQLTGGLDGVETANGRVTGVRLADGGTLEADTVLLAIGSEPAVDWLRADAALDTADGLRCDEYCAAAPGVYAAGDVARWYHPGHGRHLRIEHRMNATEQAMAAAKNLLVELGVSQDERRPFTPVPYFWSDQYGMKLQAYGVLAGADRAETVLLDKEQRQVAALYGRDGQATGVLAAGLPPRQIRGLRAVIATPGPWEEAHQRLLAAVGAE
ncbi:NAD(P)/FAD-dependent oxidoreductase [Streptomyces ochraceiscleroticus]|uniref:NAD(P)/FAD-dependent oxidoreductase n=1 Tax=Streptomyces ochraceiscleroticus TaxID=47761 RepID=A0ABW1MRN1_9ACTN|nr:FAD-dependent oxidoreductase [Streptomyces ochraceiscleroticus]